MIDLTIGAGGIFTFCATLLVLSGRTLVAAILGTIMALSILAAEIVSRIQIASETRSDSWRQARLRDWIMRDLDPPCKIVGHEYNLDPKECDWCGQTLVESSYEEAKERARAQYRKRHSIERQATAGWNSRSSEAYARYVAQKRAENRERIERLNQPLSPTHEEFHKILKEHR